MSAAIIKEIKQQFVGQHCWLVIDDIEWNAKITGNKNKFATVAPLNPNIPSVEFSWFVVNRIMRQNRVFQS
jgi:hypothetical protein